MSSRENIVSAVYQLIKDQRSVKLGVVQRDPIITEELPRTGFPAVYVQSTNEERQYITTTMSESLLEIELVLTVNGRDRDQQRNILAESIERTLLNSTELRSLVTDIQVARLENIDTGEASPYASLRMVLIARYCYSI